MTRILLLVLCLLLENKGFGLWWIKEKSVFQVVMRWNIEIIEK